MVSYKNLAMQLYPIVKVRDGYSIQVRPFVDLKTTDFGLSEDDPVFDEKIKVFYGQNQILDLHLESNLLKILVTAQFDGRRDLDFYNSLNRKLQALNINTEWYEI